MLFLDEPFNGMDPRQRLQMIDMLRSLAAAGCVVVISSHILEELNDLASNVLVMVAVTVITVWHDLAVAVISGVILSALVFAWKSAKAVLLSVGGDEDESRIYRLEGLLYFGSVRDFAEKFHPAKDPARVVLDFHEARVCDMSGLEAIKALHADGIKVVMLTGDNRTTAEAVAKAVGIDQVEADVLPDQKAAIVKSLQASGGHVAMAGETGAKMGRQWPQADGDWVRDRGPRGPGRPGGR